MDCGRLEIKQAFFLFFSVAFLVLWVVFLARENKRGEYAELKYLYTHNELEKRRFVMGIDLYDYLELSRKAMPANASYKIIGLEDLNLVRAKYMLWPARFDLNKPDFILVFKKDYQPLEGYEEFKVFKDKGFILRKINLQ